MTNTILTAAAVSALAVGSFCAIGAYALRGRDERWPAIGALLTAVALVVTIVIAAVQHADTDSGPGTGSLPTSAPPQAGTSAVERPPSAPRSDTTASPYPGATSLPADSPLRKRILNMDQVCGDLGRPAHAWLPGQTAPGSYGGRTILAPGAGYTWSCTKDGPRLTRDQITQGCQIWYPGSIAYTTDPNNAYSWICV